MQLFNVIFGLNKSIHMPSRIYLLYLYLGPCLFHDPHTMERSYTLYQNDSWTVECDNSIMPFHTSCDSNGSWNMEIRCPAMSKEEQCIYICNVNNVNFAFFLM